MNRSVFRSQFLLTGLLTPFAVFLALFLKDTTNSLIATLTGVGFSLLSIGIAWRQASLFHSNQAFPDQVSAHIPSLFPKNRALRQPGIVSLIQVARQIAEGDLNIVVQQQGLSNVHPELYQAIQDAVAYLQEIHSKIEQAARGDLTVEMRSRSEHDQLSASFGKMIQSVKSFVQKVNNKAEGVSQSSASLSATTDLTRQSMVQIANSIQQVAAGVQQQTNNLTKALESIEAVSHAMDQVSRGATDQAQAVTQATSVSDQMMAAILLVIKNANQGVSHSVDATKVASEGAAIIQRTITQMGTIKAKINTSAEKVLEMGQWSDRIGNIVETIRELSDQTNLLALNAAIEAARAGEHGRGFAVVAEEVRRLADRSTASTREVAQLIKNIQITIQQAIATIQESTSVVESGVLQANQAGHALENILKTAEALKKQNELISTTAQQMNIFSDQMTAAMQNVQIVVEHNHQAADQMTQSASQVTKSIDEIASVSEENSAAIEEISASVEAVNAQVEEGNTTAKNLSNMAFDLQQAVIKMSLNKKSGKTARGASFNGRIQFVIKKYGQQSLERVLLRLKPELQQILHARLDDKAEYPREDLEALTDAIRQELSGGSDKILQEMAAYRAQVDLTGSMAQHFKSGDPGFVMHRVDLILRHNWGGDVPVTIRDLAPNHLCIRVEKVGSIPKEACTYNNPGWFEGAIELSGARPMVKKTHCVFNGDPYCEYDVRWEMLPRSK